MSRVQRTLLIIVAGALLSTPLALAQPAGHTLRIAILDPSFDPASRYQVLRKRLRELGYAEGKNLVIEQRHAEGATERLPALAAELVASKPDIIVANGTPSARAAIQATSSIPIVFLALADPVASGLVASLGRPGGNATGLTSITTEVGAKWIELMRDIVPGAKRIAYLTDISNSGAMLGASRLQAYGRSVGITVEIFDGRRQAELERSFDSIARARFSGVIVGQASLLLPHREKIVQFAARHKLPAIYAQRIYVDAGGLLSYAADIDAQYARAAEYVHRIAQGAKPAELPVQRPDKVYMVLNLKTAREQGIVIPPSVRHRADDLID